MLGEQERLACKHLRILSTLLALGTISYGRCPSNNLQSMTRWLVFLGIVSAFSVGCGQMTSLSHNN